MEKIIKKTAEEKTPYIGASYIEKAVAIQKDRDFFFKYLEEVKQSIAGFCDALGVETFKMPDVVKYVHQGQPLPKFDPPDNIPFNIEWLALGKSAVLNKSVPKEIRQVMVLMYNNSEISSSKHAQFTLFHEIFHSMIKENFYYLYQARFADKNPQIENMENMEEMEKMYLTFWDEGMTDFFAQIAYLFHCKNNDQEPSEKTCYPMHTAFIGRCVANFAYNKLNLDLQDPKLIELDRKHCYLQATRELYNIVTGRNFEACQEFKQSLLTPNSDHNHNGNQNSNYIDPYVATPEMTEFIYWINHLEKKDKLPKPEFPIQRLDEEMISDEVADYIATQLVKSAGSQS